LRLMLQGFFFGAPGKVPIVFFQAIMKRPAVSIQLILLTPKNLMENDLPSQQYRLAFVFSTHHTTRQPPREAATRGVVLLTGSGVLDISGAIS